MVVMSASWMAVKKGWTVSMKADQMVALRVDQMIYQSVDQMAAKMGSLWASQRVFDQVDQTADRTVGHKVDLQVYLTAAVMVDYQAAQQAESMAVLMAGKKAVMLGYGKVGTKVY